VDNKQKMQEQTPSSSNELTDKQSDQLLQCLKTADDRLTKQVGKELEEMFSSYHASHDTVMQYHVKENELKDQFHRILGIMEKKQLREIYYQFSDSKLAPKVPGHGEPFYWVSLANRDEIFREIFPKSYQAEWFDEPLGMGSGWTDTSVTITNSSIPFTEKLMDERDLYGMLHRVKQYLIRKGSTQALASTFDREVGCYGVLDVSEEDRNQLFHELFGENYEIEWEEKTDVFGDKHFSYTKVAIKLTDGKEDTLPIKQAIVTKMEFLGNLHRKQGEMVAAGENTLHLFGDAGDVFYTVDFPSRDKIVRSVFGKRCQFKWIEGKRIIRGKEYRHTDLTVTVPRAGK
jgi:hypothetical protein